MTLYIDDTTNPYEEARQQRILRNQQVLSDLGIQAVHPPKVVKRNATTGKPKIYSEAAPLRKSRRQQGQASELDYETKADVDESGPCRVSAGTGIRRTPVDGSTSTA